MSFQQVIQSIIDRLKTTANVKTIFGEPVEVKGKTIIPVAKIAYGFGAGSGSTNKGETEEPEGGGGGGGIMVKPKGVLEITDEETRYISFNETRNLVLAVIMGLILGIFMTRRSNKE